MKWDQVGQVGHGIFTALIYQMLLHTYLGWLYIFQALNKPLAKSEAGLVFGIYN